MQAYKHARLMEESELRVEMAARSGPPEEMLVAGRVLEHPGAYRRWEAEHDRLLRPVSRQARLARQVVALRSTAFALVHRKAMFEYLRDRQVTGAKRHKLFALFYGARDYANCVVAEHGNYARCGSSFLCTRYLAQQLMRDAALAEPLQLYEQWYTEYFRIFCDVGLAETEEQRQLVAPLEALKPLLKHKLAEARHAILTMPQAEAVNWREAEIRRATGETQKLRVLHVEPDPAAGAVTSMPQRADPQVLNYQEFIASRPQSRRPAPNGNRG